MPLPFIPESIESMRARFHKALEKVYIPSEDMEDRPGLHRENLFDFENGLRLLISKENLQGNKIHVSASWEGGSPTDPDEATKEVGKAFRTIGGRGILELLGISIQGIPHWIVRPES